MWEVSIADVKIVNGKYAVYGVQVKGQHNELIYKRYSDFWALKLNLEKEVGSELPYEFPERKGVVFWQQSSVDPLVIEERRTKLSKFLNDLLNESFDTRWKKCKCVLEFLELSSLRETQVPVRQVVGWHELYTDCRNQVEELQKKGKCNSTALLQLRLQLSNLEEMASSNKNNQETIKRHNLLDLLKSDINDLSPANTFQQVTSSSPKKISVSHRRLGETAQTLPYNNQQLLQQHKIQMQDQDKEIQQLHTIIQRQKETSIAMNAELQQQNELLDMIDSEVDTTTTKLNRANRKVKQLNSK